MASERESMEMLATAFPEFARYMLEFPFGDFHTRAGLGERERELAGIASLTAMGHTGAHLRGHIGAALDVGCKTTEIVEVVMQTSVYAGFPVALDGLAAVREVFLERGVQLPLKPAS
jgi:4-carboxymuconolactone decarboxylase